MSSSDSLIQAVCHVVCETLRQAVPDPQHVPHVPGVDIVSVTPVAHHVCIAFRQPSVDAARTFVWVMEFPPGPQNLWSAEAIITENFLEELAIDGSRNWITKRSFDIEHLTFLGIDYDANQHG